MRVPRIGRDIPLPKDEPVEETEPGASVAEPMDLRPPQNAGGDGYFVSPPGPDADWDEIQDFALSYDGYAAFEGGPIELGPIANCIARDWRGSGELPEDLHLLRSALYFEQRRYRHFGWAPEGVALDYIRALVARIGEVSPGPLPVTRRA